MKRFKPTTPSRRHMQIADKEGLDKTRPFKKLARIKPKNAGRNSSGKITVRHQGGGNKKLFRLVDFKGTVRGIKGIVETVEYDPNRSSNICLIKWMNGQRTYVLQAKGMEKGYEIKYSEDADIKEGNRLSLKNIPVGLKLHNLELQVKKGGQLARSAGAYVTLKAKHGKYATIQLSSGETRLIFLECEATIGEVGNSDHQNEIIGKAGKNRKRGIRPTVRGSAMNAVNHPHGGGKGKAPIGQPSPRSYSGVKTLGYKTRRKKKTSSQFILSRG